MTKPNQLQRDLDELARTNPAVAKAAAEVDRVTSEIIAKHRHSRMFELHRNEDESGVSGTGVVAWGIEFPDGVVALRWISAWPTSVVFHDRGMAAVEAVHGHNGKTRIVWIATDRERIEQLEAALREAHSGGIGLLERLIVTSHGIADVQHLDATAERFEAMRQRHLALLSGSPQTSKGHQNG